MFRNRHSASSFCSRRTAAAAVLALAFGGAALAQPFGGPGGPGGPHAMMESGGPHAMMGPGAGGGGGEMMIGRAIANAKAKLNLNTQQQGMFDAAVAQSKETHQKARALHQTVKDALAAELAKPEPDFSIVAGIADGVHAQVRDLHKGARGAWLTLYGTFSAEQKAVVKELMQNRIARAEAFRNRMREHLRGGG